MLVRPAETRATHHIAGFVYRQLDEQTGNGPSTLAGLGIGDGQERVAVNGLDEAVAERVERGAESAHFVAAEHALLDGGVDRPVIDQRSARMIDEISPIEVPGAQLGDLADSAGDRVLVTLSAGLGVVDRPKPVGDLIALLESVTISVKLGLSGKPVGQVVEACRGFRDGLTVNGVVHVKWGTDPYREEHYN